MKIIALTSENIKRLTAVHIEPKDSVVVISGKNGAGKTSVLDSIWWGLSGASHIQSEPIRKGAKKAKIRLDLGELVVTRTFARGRKEGEKTTTSLTVESADGALYRSPQKVLDELLGALSFDPLAFGRAPAKEQADMLKALVPGFDFDKADAQNAADYEKRRNVNRDAKEKRASASLLELPAILLIPGAERPEPIDESALVEALEAAGKHNADIETRKANRARLERDADELVKEADASDAHAADLRARAEKAEQAGIQAREEATGIREKLAAAEALPEPIDTGKVREKIAKAREHNELCGTVAYKRELESEADKLEAEAEALTEAMEARTEAKATAIAKAKLPVEGLAFGSGEVSLAGVPFDQASDAEQLRASVAIAAALNSKLRVVRVRHGNDLDEDGMKLLAEFCEQHDLQCWIERVDSSGKVGFVIVDGHVAEKEDEVAA